MKHKLVRADGTTVLTLKSFTFTEQVNQEGEVKCGGCIASCIDCIVFGTQANAVAEGEALTYYQVFDYNTSFEYISTPREVLVGYFTAKTVITEPDNYRIIAYDSNLSKTEANYAEYLRSLGDNIPDPYAKVSEIVADAATFAGITVPTTPFSGYWRDFNLNLHAMGKIEKLTVRDLFSYIAELAGTYVSLGNGQTVTFGNYRSSNVFTTSVDGYIIAPTDTETYHPSGQSSVNLTPAFYKQGGLSYGNYNIYCPNHVLIYKTDGTLAGEYDARASEMVREIQYEVRNNPLVDLAVGYNDAFIVYNGEIVGLDSHWNDVAQTIQGMLNTYFYPSSGRYRQAEASMFTFRCPYRAGNIAEAIDTNGVRFKFPVMKCEITDSEITLIAYGKDSDSQVSGNGSTVEQTSAIQGEQLVSLQGGFYTSAQSINGTYYAYGYITNGGKSAYIVAQLPKMTLPDTLVQLASVKSAMRVVGGGYIGNAENYDVTSYVTNMSVSGSSLIILFTKSTAWTYGVGGTSSGTVVNNTPICGRVTVQGAVYYGTGGETI